MTFLDDALKLPSADSNIFVDEILHDIFQAQLKHVENSLRSGKYKGEVRDDHGVGIFFLFTRVFFVLLFLFSSPNFILTALIELKNLILRKSRSVAKIVLASC